MRDGEEGVGVEVTQQGRQSWHSTARAQGEGGKEGLAAPLEHKVLPFLHATSTSPGRE